MRLQKVTMQTGDIVSLKAFYQQLLGLNIHYEDERSFELITGPTTIRFESAENAENPYYHFAWNIPENQYLQVAEWLKSKQITLIKEPGTDNEILDFTDWNAHALYFYDPAGNIVELIARHNLDNGSDDTFDSQSFLELSEVSVVSKAYARTFDYITKELNIPFWKGNHADFNALGDEHGLFITVPEGRQWFMSDKQAVCFPIEINFTQDEKNKTVYF